MRILVPKNAYWKGAKKHEVKKVIKSPKKSCKSCLKFCKLGDDFFILTKSQNEDFAYKTRVFSPVAPKNQNFDEKLQSHAQIP